MLTKYIVYKIISIHIPLIIIQELYGNCHSWNFSVKKTVIWTNNDKIPLQIYYLATDFINCTIRIY